MLHPKQKKLIFEVNPTINLEMTGRGDIRIIYSFYKNTTGWRHLGKRLQNTLPNVYYLHIQNVWVKSPLKSRQSTMLKISNGNVPVCKECHMTLIKAKL
jgi:hypothetical protein